MAYWELEAGKCPQCGGPEGECADPERVWFPQMTVCYSTMERDAANARFDRNHEKKQFHDGTRTSWSEKPDAGHPYPYRAGVTIWVSPQDHGLGGDFLSP